MSSRRPVTSAPYLAKPPAIDTSPLIPLNTGPAKSPISRAGSAPALSAPVRGTRSPIPKRVDTVAPTARSIKPRITYGDIPGATLSTHSAVAFSMLATLRPSICAIVSTMSARSSANGMPFRPLIINSKPSINNCPRTGMLRSSWTVMITNCLYMNMYWATLPRAISGRLNMAYSPCDVLTAIRAASVASAIACSSLNPCDNARSFSSLYAASAVMRRLACSV